MLACVFVLGKLEIAVHTRRGFDSHTSRASTAAHRVMPPVEGVKRRMGGGGKGDGGVGWRRTSAKTAFPVHGPRPRTNKTQPDTTPLPLMSACASNANTPLHSAPSHSLSLSLCHTRRIATTPIWELHVSSQTAATTTACDDNNGSCSCHHHSAPHANKTNARTFCLQWARITLCY